MNKNILLIALIFTLLSCKKRIENGRTVIKKKTEIVDENSIPEIDSKKLNKKFPEPLNLKNIKNLEFLTTTSGVVAHSQVESLCKQDEEGFYGFYYLINKEKKHRKIGLLTVYTTDKPENWKFNSENESLSIIELQTDDLKVWDSIAVGISQSKLLNFIGKNFHYKKGSTLYTEIGEYKSSFTISKDTISEILIVKSCNIKRK